MKSEFPENELASIPVVTTFSRLHCTLTICWICLFQAKPQLKSTDNEPEKIFVRMARPFNQTTFNQLHNGLFHETSWETFSLNMSTGSSEIFIEQ